MAYDSVNKKISAPVSFYDVQLCLGTDLTYLNELCTHINVNKWSKYKPVVNNNIFTSSKSLWWKGDDGKCGLNITEYNTLAALIAAYNAGPIDWAYQKPTGGAASPYRLTDFNGYFHGATTPFLNWACSSSGNNMYANSTIGANMMVRFVDADDLALSDISDYANWYFGAVITNGTTTKAGSSPSTLINTGFSAFVPTVGIPVGNYDIFPFISPVPIDQNPTTFIALDGFAKKSVYIANSPYSVSINADWNVNKTQCNYTIYITNNGGSTALTGCNVMLRENSKAWNDTLVQYEESMGIANITAAVGNTTTITGVLDVTNYFAFNDWRFWFYANGGNIKASVVLMKQIEL